MRDARTSDAVAHLFDGTLTRMQAVPGVERAAAALTLPLRARFEPRSASRGATPPSQMINMTYVTPEYFGALRIPVVRGRAFASSDGPGAPPVIVVNQAFVRRHSPDEEPIGRQVPERRRGQDDRRRRRRRSAEDQLRLGSGPFRRGARVLRARITDLERLRDDGAHVVFTELDRPAVRSTGRHRRSRWAGGGVGGSAAAGGEVPHAR